MNQHSMDLAFPVRGRTIPTDHAYPLYGALSRLLPLVHRADWIGIHGIGGKRLETGELAIDVRGVLRLRVPAERIAMLLALTGTTIEVAGHPVEIGAPTVHALTPVATLDARLVVIRLTGGVPKPFDRAMFESRFIAEAQRQLVKYGIRGDLELSGRNSLRVGGQRVIGYAVRVRGLSPDHSLELQSRGIGGKRTMGCGLFRPARIRELARQVV
ncbi:type I-MYXAN CRISPR-associated protein Cas6/Cmx6 [soil metagenome]